MTEQDQIKQSKEIERKARRLRYLKTCGMLEYQNAEGFWCRKCPKCKAPVVYPTLDQCRVRQLALNAGRCKICFGKYMTGRPKDIQPLSDHRPKLILGEEKRYRMNGMPDWVFKVVKATCPKCRASRVRKVLTLLPTCMCDKCFADIEWAPKSE